jgi:hypothetical protein
MLNKINKIISILLTIIFIAGIFPPVIFAEPNQVSLGEVKGFNKAVIDSHFSKADRELNPEHWLAEAKFGITQAICAWELIAGNLYDNPLLYEEAKAQIEKWSDEELEKRFSQWLMGRFFGKAAEEALINLSSRFSESQKNYSWHLDEDGNIIFDEKTGDPLVIRPNEEGREFSGDLALWHNDSNNILKNTNASFDNAMIRLYPELLAYIPEESRESMEAMINETLTTQKNVIKQEFESIAAREERIFTNRITRDIWSLRKKSDDEAAKIFTEKLIAETDVSCKKGIEELNAKIEQASAGAGDLAILGEEWLRLYKEQFERGLKAWEDAEERFFIRRIEWEQDSFKLFEEGQDVWLAAFNQFEEERQKWELNAGELFRTGENLFAKISEDFEKNITAARNEFELNVVIRAKEGTNKVKALIDIYLTCASTTASLIENIKFWQNQYGNTEKGIRDEDFSDWILQEMENVWRETETSYLNDPTYIKDLSELNRYSPSSYIYEQRLKAFKLKYSNLFKVREILEGETPLDEQIALAKSLNDGYFHKFKFEALIEMQNSYKTYLLYSKLSLNAREEILKNYAELFDTEMIKDILSPNVSSDDFYLDEYQIALLRAKALVLYWERKSSIVDAVKNYAEELSAGRMTEAEGIRAWEEAKNAYNASLAAYEKELSNLNKIGEDVQKQQEKLSRLTAQLQHEEDILNNLYSEKNSLVSLSLVNMENFYSKDFNEKYNDLIKKYDNFLKTGTDSVYFSALKIGMLWDIAEQREAMKTINTMLENSDELSEKEVTDFNNKLIALSPDFQENLRQNTRNALLQLFASYNLETEQNIFPDVQFLCQAIFFESENFLENTIQFLSAFNECFSDVPEWLDYEIQNWEAAFIEYITMFAVSQNFQLKQTSAELIELRKDLHDYYFNLINDFKTAGYTDDKIIEQINSNDEILSILNNLMILNYKIRITESWEKMNSSASAKNEKHWRQYLTNDLIKNEEPSLNEEQNLKKTSLFVSSLKEGILADALFYANYYTNRINDSFNIYAQKDAYTSNETAEQLFNLYTKEINKVNYDFDLLYSQYNVIIDTAKAYILSRQPPDEILKQIADLEEKIKKQEIAVNPLKEQFFTEADNFIDISSRYDNQYKILNTAHNNTDKKRLEYEKQDAIQRWASSSYISADNIDPDNCGVKLVKAQTVLNVLSDISKKENKITYNNPEYEALYAAYEQSFSNKLKVLETIQTLSAAYTQEAMYNSEIYNKYQNYLFGLGTNFNYQNYTLPELNSEWRLENVIIVKNGRLAFSGNGSTTLAGVSSEEAKTVIDFFDTKKPINGERFDISDFEKALRGLSERMSDYFKDPNKFQQWSYARNYLLSSLINANGNLSFLSNNFSTREELGSNGSLANEYIKLSWYVNPITLGPLMEATFFHIYPETLFKDAWNKLSAAERADLEFYVILTLTANNNEDFAGFKDIYTYNAYAFAADVTYHLYSEANKILNNKLRILEWPLWTESRDINKNTYNRVNSLYSAIYNRVNKWKTSLNSNFNSIKSTSSLYTASCEKLDNLEGIKKEGEKITWADLEMSLSLSKINLDDIALIKNCWEKMQKNDSGTAYKGVFEALTDLLYWADNQVKSSKNNLETRFTADMQNQQENEGIFLTLADNYINGTANINDVKDAAKKAYTQNTISSKYYLDNMYGTLIDNLSMYTNTDFNFYSLFNDKGNEIISLTDKIIRNKYNAELTAREAEWAMTGKDLTEKYNEWQRTAGIILENGRTDWTESYKKMQDAYKQWNANFQSEYERVKNEWAYAYLAGLEDKEKWLEQAADAVNQASSEAFLSLVGAEGERLSRFMDTREPFGIRDAVPEAQALMTSLLQSSGIVNMASAFSSLNNNYTGITSPLVKRGIGGSSSWDSALVKASASTFAKEANAEIAKSESKKLAYSARLAAEEAVKGLADNVNTANQNFRDNMDNMFVFKGLWSKSGNNYVKDIVKGSTLFEPVVTQTVNITGYKNYIMEPVKLKSKLDDDFLSGLDTIAIQGLINNVYVEVQTIAGDIFGNDQKSIPITKNGVNREQSPGKFGAHIGYSPAEKTQGTKSRSEMFYDEGSGELGRLMSDFQYWLVIDKMGSAELAIAPWDKRMWNDEGSWFESPSLRNVGVIAGSIAASVLVTAGTLGTGTGLGVAAGIALSVALCSSSEIALGALDVAFEYKNFDKVAVSVGKTILTNTVTSVIGGAFSSISLVGSSFLTQTLMTGTQTLTTGLATNLISGITYNSEKGFGYSIETFNAGMKGTLNSALTSMASTFVSSGLTAINSGINNSKTGLDYSKLKGLNNLNQADLQKFNGLVGSLAGQGVNYALGNDFTLNVLNLSLLTENEKYNSGLLELHLGHDGVKMNLGTGGANVSIDNLVAAYRGAQVWNVNTKISNYGKEKDFDALIALRVQYGYGDNRQKEQLFDILNGKALINTKAEGDYFAETTINEDGKRVINLSGYKNGMSEADQFLLGVVLGYEAYRDGYTIGQTDANGVKVTYEAQTKEFRDAQIAKLAMGDRIQAENNWFYEKFEGLAQESVLLKIAQMSDKMQSFYDYMESKYDNSKDYLCISAATKGDYQNDYKKDLLFGSLDKDLDKEKIENINAQRLQAAFEKYNAKENLTGDEQESQKLYDEFINNKKLQADNGYSAISTTTISDAGCMFMSTKYLIEAITKKEISTIELHNFIKDEKLYIGDNMLSKYKIADIINKYTNNEYDVKYNDAFSNKLTDLCEKIGLMSNLTNENVTSERGKIERQLIETLKKIESPDEKYVIHLRIKEPGNKNAIVHSVAVSSIDYTYDKAGNINGIKQINVANPFISSTHFNGKISYLPNQIERWDVYKVNK